MKDNTQNSLVGKSVKRIRIGVIIESHKIPDSVNYLDVFKVIYPDESAEILLNSKDESDNSFVFV